MEFSAAGSGESYKYRQLKEEFGQIYRAEVYEWLLVQDIGGIVCLGQGCSIFWCLGGNSWGASATSWWYLSFGHFMIQRTGLIQHGGGEKGKIVQQRWEGYMYDGC